jgi:hypothetical protein
MFDLDNYSFDVECPRCYFYNPLSLKQVRLRDAVICRGCKTTIKLEDHMNETRKAIRSIHNAVRDLEDQFNKMRNIKIRF